jgi:hypothetical protein
MNVYRNVAVLFAFEVVGSGNKAFLSAAFWSPELAIVIRGIEHVVKSAVIVALISKDFIQAFKYFMFVSHLYSTKIMF